MVTPEQLVTRLDGAHGLLCFDSGRAVNAQASNPREDARWSIVLAYPSLILTQDMDTGAFIEQPSGRLVDDLWAWLREHSAPDEAAKAAPPEVPFTAGVAGMLGFELAWALDPPYAERPKARTPALWVGCFEAAACFDHHNARWVLTGDRGSAGFRALDEALASLAMSPWAEPLEAPLEPPPTRWLMPADTASAHYAHKVSQAIEGIFCGDLFEVNYTERLEFTWPRSPLSLYRRLRRVATGSFMGYLDAGSWQLLSASPEQLLGISPAGLITTRPIKGSRRRSLDPQEDLEQAQALLGSAKDRAENIMIVDLMRNDLTQVCELGSVVATELCALESFAGIHHLVSTVQGQLLPSCAPTDALLACFPAGSITGAPKLRAIEYITQLESSARGAYTGSLFYASRHGRLDSSVLIRTIELHGQQARYGAGGAVISDSDPAAEYEEAWLKASPLFKALNDE